ncbi:extracellular catalytic domain type 2 short-chain-length polyhydroxyalkanoate depolymerase [Vibrio quintilis]|nr:PHB depolymerase family esterase [Vibrio quintilis]
MMKQTQLNLPKFLAIILVFIFTFQADATEKLPALGADIQNTSVSGLSSGGYMAGQFFMAHSAMMKGVGIVGAGPYLCSGSWPLPYEIASVTTCKNPRYSFWEPNTPHLIATTRQLSASGKIDDIQHLKTAHYYIFGGLNDQTVTQRVVDQNISFFQSLGVSERAIWYDDNVNAGHAFITDNPQDSACSVTRSPYINNCGFSQAGRILSQIYPDFTASETNPAATPEAFDQSEFIQEPFTSMDETGYVYIPPQCKSGTTCAVHVIFHGCRQGATVIGDKFYTGTGYNQYADANHLILLYPQVHRSASLTATEPENPKGCWDYWGYSEPQNPFGDFYTKDAPQIRAVYRMIQRLTSPGH